MRILITNDDAYHARSMQELAFALSGEHEVYVVVPQDNSSGISQALTLRTPLFLSPVDEFENPLNLKNFYALKGTPSDCVKFSLLHLLKKNPPDLVISGINYGANLGCDVLYSGTVAGAREARINAISGISLSYTAVTIPQNRLQEMIQWFCKKLHVLKPWLMEKPRLLNINYPDLDASMISGEKVCTVGKLGYIDYYQEMQTPNKRSSYWLAGSMKFEGEDEDSDKLAIRRGMISLSPLRLDQTLHEELASLGGAVCK